MTRRTAGCRDAAAEIFGAEATAEEAYDLLTVDVPARVLVAALPSPATNWAAPSSTG